MDGSDQSCKTSCPLQSDPDTTLIKKEPAERFAVSVCGSRTPHHMHETRFRIVQNLANT